MFCLTVDDDLKLCLLEERHAAALFALVDKNRQHLRQWLPWVDSTTAVDDNKAFIQSALQQFANNEGFQTALFYQGHLVGMVGYHTIDWLNRSVEIGYWIGADFQGRGLIARACRFMTDYAFNQLGLNRVVIRCAVGNTRSAAIPRQLGFTQEGVFRQQQTLNNQFIDLIVFSVLAEEWSG